MIHRSQWPAPQQIRHSPVNLNRPAGRDGIGQSLGQSCRAAGMLLLIALVPLSVAAGDGEKALRDAGCSDEVIITYIEQGKRAATQQAQKEVDIPCVQAAMRLGNPTDSNVSEPSQATSRRQNWGRLAEKRAEFARVFTKKRTELENYIKNPGAEVCPDIDVLNDASALPWMQDLAVNTKALCTRITEWERLEKRRSNSPKTHLAPNVTGKALSEALNEVAVLYPFPFGKKKIPEPRWITTSRIDVNCVVSFEQHVNTFLSMRKFDRISQAGADALERALAALNAGCNPAVSNFRIPKEQVKKRLAGIRDAIRRKPPSAIAASSAQATIVSSATTINGLLDEIDRKVEDDPSALGDLPDQWSEQAKSFIGVGNFPKAYEKLLGLLKHYNTCKENHSRVYSENEISSNCQKYNPKALLNTGNQDGQFLVNWDPVVFHDLVRDAHAEAKKSPRPQNRQLAQPHRTWSSLFSVVNKMSKQGWINNANRHGIQAFEDKVVEQLASVGYDYSTYVSEDTRRAVAPDPAWIWVAFADCRIFEKRWKDAIENLVIAATKTTEENQSTRKLIVLRLQKASEEAKAKSVPEYGPENLEAMVKKLTRVKSPEWLLTELRDNSSLRPRLSPPRAIDKFF
jgi:hypothetical protein